MVLEAIRYKSAVGNSGPSLEILDQLALPYQTIFFSINTCEDAHDAIKQMKVRGAPAIAIVAALALAVEVGQDASRDSRNAREISEHIQKRLSYLKSSRPTAVNLGNAVGKLSALVSQTSRQDKISVTDVYKAYIKAAERMLVDDVSDNEAIGNHGARWISENASVGEGGSLSVITHCNTGYALRVQLKTSG